MLDRQLETMGTLDGKALQVLQLDTAVIGFILTALSLLSATPTLRPGVFFSIFAQVGLVFLVVSIGLTLLTYSTKRVRGGISAGSLGEIATKSDQSKAESRYYRGILKTYSEAVDTNHTVIQYKNATLQAGLLCTVYGISFLSLSIVRGLFGQVPIVVLVLVGASLVTVTWAIDLKAQSISIRKYFNTS